MAAVHVAPEPIRKIVRAWLEERKAKRAFYGVPPNCKGHNKDGGLCALHALTGSDFCQVHGRQASENAAGSDPSNPLHS